MTTYAQTGERRFVRNADRACLGGVCAGIADYFGFNVCAVRILFVIAFFMFMPFVALAYIGMVLLVPAESGRYAYGEKRRRRRRRKSRKQARREQREADEAQRRAAREAVRERYRSLDERLARIEKYVTSSRYDLDREFRNL